MSTQPTQPGHASTRSKTYYFQTIIFELDDTLYRVPKQGFERWSQSIFPDMFSLPIDNTPGQPREGEADEHPIRLVGCTKGEFESLLELIYPTKTIGLPTFSRCEWISVLKLSKLWDMPEAASLAIEKLETFAITPIDKIRLGKAYSISSWLKDGYTSLVGDVSGVVSLQEMSSLGWEVACRILWAREKFSRKHSADGLQLACGRCCSKNRYETLQKKDEGSHRCPFCGGVPGKGDGRTGWGVYIMADSPGLERFLKGPLLASCVQAGAVEECVSEVFGEEIDDAERHSAACASR